jgi:hypothetical protein
MRLTRVLLDANILFDAQARDLFLRFAEAEQIEVFWSRPILAETRRNLIAKRGMTEAKADGLFDAMANAFPHAVVEGFEHLIGQLELPDADDRHVLAAAIHAECDMVITNNRRDFPDVVLEPYDVLALDLDEALMLFAGFLQPVVSSVIQRLVAALSRPAESVDEFIERLAVKAPTGAVLLGSAMGIERFQRLAAEIVDGVAGDTAQAAAQRLMEAIWEQRIDDVAAIVDSSLAAQLVGENATAGDLTARLSDIFRDVDAEHGWGMTARRHPISVDIEIVRFIQGGARIISQPTLARTYQLAFQRVDEAWKLIDLPAQT